MSSSMEAYEPDDFVFAKMQGYPPWPGIIMTPDPDAPPKQKNTQWIYFFGSHNYAWIEERHIHHFDAHKEKFKAIYRQATFRNAVKELEDIIESMANDPDYQIECVKYTAKDKQSVTPTKPKKSNSNTGERKRPLSLKERNTLVPKKRSRSSVSSDDTSESSYSPILRSMSDSYLHKRNALNTCNIKTSKKLFGFLAANVYAEGIIRNLIKSGHRLHFWSRSLAMNTELQEYAEQQQTYLKVFQTPSEVVKHSDITFSCCSNPEEAYKMIQNLDESDNGTSVLNGKGYVEMTSISPDHSKDFQEWIRNKGGIYLEAMIQGCRRDSNEGQLIVLAAGPEELFEDCQSSFKAMGKASYLLSKDKKKSEDGSTVHYTVVGSASKIHLIFQCMRGTFLAALAEGVAMADSCLIKLETFKSIFDTSQICSDYLKSKVDIITDRKYGDTEEPLQQLQQDLAQALEMSNRFRQPMPLASTANQILKHARRLGWDNQDSANINCVEEVIRFDQADKQTVEPKGD